MIGSTDDSDATFRDWLIACARDSLQIAVHLALFWCLRKSVFSIGNLNEEAYWSPSLIVEIGQRFLTNSQYWLLPIGILLLRNLLFADWNTVESGRPLRWFSTGLAIMLAAVFGGQEFNLFFDQAYTVDRIVLFLLAGLVALRPIFIVPFVLLTIGIGGQFCFPISAYEWQHHLLGVYRLPIHLLLVILCGILFEAKDHTAGPQLWSWPFPELSRVFLVLIGRTNVTRSLPFCSTVLLMLVIVASGYWVPGIAKLRMGWMTVPNVHMAFFGAWCHGWLASVEPERVAAITAHIKPFSGLLQFATILFECGALFILCRRFSLLLLPLWILFHLSAIALFGYAFWMWALIDLSVFLFVKFCPHRLNSFRWQHVLISMLLISTSWRWLSPNQLAWFHAPLCNNYRFVAVGSSGTRYVLPPQFFAPYDYIFTMNSFDYAATQRTISGPYATTVNTDIVVMPGLQLAEIDARSPAKPADPVSTAELTRFLKNYLQHWNTNRSNASAFGIIEPPSLLNATLEDVVIPAHEQIKLVEVIRVRSVLLPDTVVKMDVEVCLTVAIPVQFEPKTP